MILPRDLISMPFHVSTNLVLAGAVSAHLYDYLFSPPPNAFAFVRPCVEIGIESNYMYN